MVDEAKTTPLVKGEPNKEDNKDIQAILGKMVEAMEATNSRFEARFSSLEKKLVSKDAPPKQDSKTVEGGAEGFNPQAEGEEADDDDNYRASESTVKPTSPTTGPGNFKDRPALGKGKPAPKPAAAKPAAPAPVRPTLKMSEIKEMMAKAAAEAAKAEREALLKEIPELVKAHTPLPMGMPATEEARTWQKDPYSVIRKAIAQDRAVCGGSYAADDYWGFKTGSGAGVDITPERVESVRWVKKALGDA